MSLAETEEEKEMSEIEDIQKQRRVEFFLTVYPDSKALKIETNLESQEGIVEFLAPVLEYFKSPIKDKVLNLGTHNGITFVPSIEYENKINNLQNSLAQKSQALEAAREALEKLNHRYSCRYLEPIMEGCIALPCDCGKDVALAAVESALKGKG